MPRLHDMVWTTCTYSVLLLPRVRVIVPPVGVRLNLRAPAAVVAREHVTIRPELTGRVLAREDVEVVLREPVALSHLPAAWHLSLVFAYPEDGRLRGVVREVPREGVDEDEERDHTDGGLENMRFAPLLDIVLHDDDTHTKPGESTTEVRRVR